MRQQNIGEVERSVCAAIGAGMLTLALRELVRRRRLSGLSLAAGGALLVGRGLSGHSAAYDLLGVEPDDATPTSNPFTRRIRISRSVTVNASPEDLYQRWRRLEDLPSIMSHLKEVEVLNDTRSRWTARGPFDRDVTWEAEIVSDEPNRFISWQSVGDGPVETSGHVEFTPHVGGRGTMIRVELEYRPTGGAIGALAAKLFGSDPAMEIDADLRRFKQFVETGEVATGDRRCTRAETTPHEPIAERNKEHQLDPVETAVEASFPASDPPAWSGQ